MVRKTSSRKRKPAKTKPKENQDDFKDYISKRVRQAIEVCRLSPDNGLGFQQDLKILLALSEAERFEFLLIQLSLHSELLRNIHATLTLAAK